MINLFRRNTTIVLTIFLVVELLSFFSFDISWANRIIFAVLVLIALAISTYRLEYGLLMVLAELFIGSKGHIFYWQFPEWQFSLRLGLWLAVVLVFVVKFIWQIVKQKNQAPYWQGIRKFIFWKPFAWLFLFVVLSLGIAWFHGNAITNIFFDFNAWLYFILILPILAIYNQDNQVAKDNLKTLFFVAAVWLSLKTLILLFIFTHTLSFEGEIYTWLRKTLVGEMTPTKTGWPRIFIQSQIFPIIAYFILFWYSQVKCRVKPFFVSGRWPLLLMGGLFFSSLLISFSRSFWLGAFATTMVSLAMVWRLQSFRKMISAVIWLVVTSILGFAITYLVAVLPISQPDGFRVDLLDRVSNSQEAAVVSRWSLLSPLMNEVKKSPIIGQGFGATVTYVSSDPRVLENNPDGQYTTYAFEWGYIDIWLKIGLLGLMAYLFVLYRVYSASISMGIKKNSYLLLGLSAGMLFLIITHFFTPYLNHPLGIGFLLLASCLISQDRVY